MRIFHMRYTLMKNATVWTHRVDHDRNLCKSGRRNGRARQGHAKPETEKGHRRGMARSSSHDTFLLRDVAIVRAQRRIPDAYDILQYYTW